MMTPFSTLLRRCVLAVLGVCACVASVGARQVSIHDPVIGRDQGRYYLYSTGPGITFYSSSDLKAWTRRGRIFADEPAWARQVAPEFNGHIWAPDIFERDGTFYLYYSVSAFAKNTSGIGVTINRTLDPDSPDYRWEDQGVILQSVPDRDLWNAIDPNLIVDETGTPWMSFGSFWGGLKLVKMSADLVHVAEPQEWHTIAKRDRPGLLDDRKAGPAAVEAPFIFRQNGYFYLFVSWDFCCRGKDSTYRLMVGRSRDVRGPYLDREGVSLAEGGGTLLMEGDADWPGVGHNSVYTFDGTDYLIFHAYETADNGLQKLKIAALSWDDEGWPVVDPEALHGFVSEQTN